MIQSIVRAACVAALLAIAGTLHASGPAVLRVALYDDQGAGDSLAEVAKVLAGRADIQVERIKAADIRSGRLAGFDVLIQPGGSGGAQGRRLGKEGREQVRTFIKEGGGYVGICAGAYLATCQYDWSLGVLDAKVIDGQHWARGYGHVDLSLSDEGRAILAIDARQRPMYYHQGPLLAPAGEPDLPDYATWATYAGEIAENGAPKGVMPGTTAIAAGHFGEGRVLCFSPHPEKTDGLRDVLYRGVVWSAAHPPEAALSDTAPAAAVEP